MIYKVNLTDKANNQFRNLSSSDFQTVMNELTELSIFPRPTKAEKLRLRPAYRLHIGNFRLLYVINDSDQEVKVLHII